MTTACTDRAAATPLEAADLQELMRAFDQATGRLQRTHDELQRQVGRLQEELAEANAQLRRSRSLAALGEMAAGIAHEVRNPLGSIQLYAQVLADELAADPERLALCTRISRAVSGLDAIVRDVLAFARETRLRPAPTTAGELFERALESCEALVRQRAAALSGPSGGGCRLEADAALLTQALANLVRNALEAMAEQPPEYNRLDLAAERRTVRCPDGRRAARVVLSVADTGPGIPAEARKRMFNPFFTTRATGTGLGLAIVHRIVDAHGGHINVRDREPQGTCIELCLPQRPPPGSSAAA